MWNQNAETLGGLYVSYLATQQQIKILLETKWCDDIDDPSENKQRMKSVGASAIRYKKFLNTSAILILAKSIEDCIFFVKKDTGDTINFWRDARRYQCGDIAKEIRSLANVIKHNVNIVEGKDCEFLIKKCSYREGASLDSMMSNEEGIFDIPETISKMFVFLASMVEVHTGMRHPIQSISPDEWGAKIKAILVPDVLKL